MKGRPTGGASDRQHPQRQRRRQVRAEALPRGPRCKCRIKPDAQGTLICRRYAQRKLATKLDVFDLIQARLK